MSQEEDRIYIPTYVDGDDGEPILIHDVRARVTESGHLALTLRRHRVKKGTDHEVSAVLKAKEAKTLGDWIEEYF